VCASVCVKKKREVDRKTERECKGNSEIKKERRTRTHARTYTPERERERERKSKKE